MHLLRVRLLSQQGEHSPIEIAAIEGAFVRGISFDPQDRDGCWCLSIGGKRGECRWSVRGNVNVGVNLALAHFACRLRLSSRQDPQAEEVEVSLAVHLAFEQFESRNLALHLS